MEKTPRRSAPPTGSVVVDPTSQLPSSPNSSGPNSSGPASSGRRASQAGGQARRKGEATLVLDARRVDTLRRQVLDRQRVQQQGQRRQVVLWALAGAGAVLLGGWLATRLSPTSDHAEDPLVLGRSEALAPPPAPNEGSEPPVLDAQVGGPTRPRAGAARVVSAGLGSPSRTSPATDDAQAEEDAATQERTAAQAADPSAGERSPEDPKVVGDWGDGFDSAGRARSDRARSDGRVQRGPPPRPAPAGSDVFDLDELPTE